MDNVILKKNNIKKITKLTKTISVTPEEAKETLIQQNTSQLKQKVKMADLLARPQISIKDLIGMSASFKTAIDNISPTTEELECSEILLKYKGYIEKEKDLVSKLSKLNDIPLKKDFDYNKLSSLSTEAREKLTRIKPATIGQAARISGVSPSDINVLAVFIGR